MVRPRSGLIGTPAFPGMVTESGELVILAVQRGGEDLGPGETALAAGDTLLVEGTWEALEEQLDDPDVLVVDAPEQVRRQAVPMGPGSRPTLAVLAGDGRPARHRGRPGGGGRAAGRRGPAPAAAC